MNMSQLRSHPTHVISPQSHPYAPFRGHFQLLDPQALLLAQQAQSARAQAHAQVHSQPHSQAAQAQFQTHLQSHAQLIAQLHNANAIAPAHAVNVPSSSSVTGSAGRVAQRLPSWLSGSANANQSLPFNTAEPNQAAQQRKRDLQLPEKQVQEKVAELLPESALYTKLLDFEAKIDAAMEKKKIEIQEGVRVRCPPHVQKTLRVYVFNTFSSQTKVDSLSEKKSAEEASWSLKIIGRILEDDKDPAVAGTSQATSPSYPKFSAFFKRITIYLDQSLCPDDHVIVWESALSSTQQDGFEVRRKGDKEFTARIKIEMNYTPEKFLLSIQLSELLGIKVETHPRIVAALWDYIKSRKLQSPNDPLFFMCDPPLKRVFGEEKMEFKMAVAKLSHHLTRPQPIQLEHRIKLSGDCLEGISCYDIQVDVPFTLEKDMSALLAMANSESNKQIEAYDEQIRASFKNLHEHRRRRAFFLSFSESPEEFVNAFIASQCKELNLASGDANHKAEKKIRSELYNQPW